MFGGTNAEADGTSPCTAREDSTRCYPTFDGGEGNERAVRVVAASEREPTNRWKEQSQENRDTEDRSDEQEERGTRDHSRKIAEDDRPQCPGNSGNT